MGVAQITPATIPAFLSVWKAYCSCNFFCSSEGWPPYIGVDEKIDRCEKALPSKESLRMTLISPFQLEDLLDANSVNLDPLTENFNLLFYMEYLNLWPGLFFKATEPVLNSTEMAGYMMGKTEGQLARNEWHTHITAVTVQDTYRRIGLALKLCLQLERITGGDPHNTWFVDLFVKVTNELARKMYEKLGYSVYRRVVGYYGRLVPSDRDAIDDDVDAFDMRKLLPADKEEVTTRVDGHKHYVLPQEVVF